MSIQNAFPAARSERLPSGVAIQPRRFDFDDLEAVPRYWFGGNPLLTHFENAFSITIPPGERFFIRSVRAFEDRVEEPAMRELIRAFVQQEALHGSAHDHFNRTLARHGVDVDRESAAAERAFRRIDRFVPARVRLGMTVFLEHLTATGAHVLFTVPEVQEAMDEQMLGFWRWHAAEELEHKSVAFDLFRHVGGGYGLRVFSAWLAVLWLAGPLLLSVRRMLRDDPTPVTPEVKARARALHRRAAGVQGPLLRAYFRRRFHPWELHDEDSLRAWYASPEGAS